MRSKHIFSALTRLRVKRVSARNERENVCVCVYTALGPEWARVFKWSYPKKTFIQYFMNAEIPVYFKIVSFITAEQIVTTCVKLIYCLTILFCHTYYLLYYVLKCTITVTILKSQDPVTIFDINDFQQTSSMIFTIRYPNCKTRFR